MNVFKKFGAWLKGGDPIQSVDGRCSNGQDDDVVLTMHWDTETESFVPGMPPSIEEVHGVTPAAKAKARKETKARPGSTLRKVVTQGRRKKVTSKPSAKKQVTKKKIVRKKKRAV